MYLSSFQRKLPHKKARIAWAGVLLALLALIISACQSAAPATPAPTEAPTVAPTEVPTVEPTVAPTEVPTVEPTAEPTEAPVAMGGDAANGLYIATIAGGCGCHFNRDLSALAGGNKFEGPFGVVYAPNLTPDQDTGIGTWSAEEIALALQTGAAPGGEQLHPVMPYMAYSLLSDKEALDLAAYLHSLEAVANPVPERELTGGDPAPFTPAAAPPAEAPTDPVARGAELVSVARCSGCHTPKNEDGSAMEGMVLAGSPIQDEFAANITPDEETGIGAWSEEAIAEFMRTGTLPDGTQVEGAMAQQIDRRFNELTEADAMAIAAYLKSIPAVANSAPQ